jgi:hypothetical protein
MRTAAPTGVDGGPGNDDIDSHAGDDEIDGGPGDD